MASCFFLTRNTVDMYKITKTVIFSRAWEFGFSMSPRDMYYQFYKNAPIERRAGALEKGSPDRMCLSLLTVPLSST